MKAVTKWVVLVLLATAPGLAAAAGGVLNWTTPTQYTDGTPLPGSAITGYNVQCSSFTPTGSTIPGTCSTPSPASFSGSLVSGTITLVIPAGGGRACFQLQTVAGTAVSAWTGDACKTFPALVPNPPSGVTIAVVIDVNIAPVYSVASNNTLGTFMGFAFPGTPCYGPTLITYRGATFHEVRETDVKLWGKTSAKLAAPCA